MRIAYEWVSPLRVEVRGPGVQVTTISTADYASHVETSRARPGATVDEIPRLVTRSFDEARQSQSQSESDRGADTDADADAALRSRLPEPMRSRAFPHQLAGIRFMLQKKRCLLADEMGLGKTVQALGLCWLVEPRRALVLVLPTLVGQWVSETQKWLPDASVAAVTSSRVEVFRPGHAAPTRKRVRGSDASSCEFPDVDVVVCAYTAVELESSRFFDAVRRVRWSVVVADEAHRFQSNVSQRSRNMVLNPTGVLGTPKNAHVALVTGTPIQSRPCEAYALMCSVFGSMPYRDFTTRYCDGHTDARFGKTFWDATGSSNDRELATWMGTRMLRRLERTTVCLRPLVRTKTVLCAPAHAGFKAHVALLHAYHAKVRELGRESANKRLLQEVQRLKMDLWRDAASLKISLMRGLVEDRVRGLARGEKLIFFAHHTCVREYVRFVLERLGVECVEIAGTTAIHDRFALCQRLVAADNDVRVGIFSIRAASAGLNCTPTVTRVVFLELDWTVGRLRQGEKRAHRMGATETITSEYVVVAGTVEDEMMRMLARKDTTVAGIVDFLASNDKFVFSATESLDVGSSEHDQKELEVFWRGFEAKFRNKKIVEDEPELEE